MCASGTCKCPNGQDLCNGACVNLQTTSNDCGKCGNACTGGMQCTGGACGCPPKTTACGANDAGAGGTCVDTSSDPTDCGTRGNACAAALFCTVAIRAACCPVTA